MKNHGFTLVEILIALSILAILAFIALIAFRSQTFKGYDAKRKSDMNRIAIAVEEYEKDHSCYPLPQLVVCKPGNGLQPYLNKIPCDPVTGASYYYDYQNSVCPSWFRVFSILQNKTDSAIIPGIGPNAAFNFYLGSANSPAVISQSPAPSSGGGVSLTPTPGGNTGGNSGFYGCINGSCVPINWDSSRPGPACDPNYQNSSCYGQCGSQMNECVSWR